MQQSSPTTPRADAPGAAAATGPAELPARANETTAERPWPVRLLSVKIADYVAKMSPLWVEGQVVQLNRRPGANVAFLTLRDTDTDMSLPVSMPAGVLSGAATPLAEGAHVVVHARPTFWTKRGTLQLNADEIRAVGVGELLARIEHLKRVLAAEGLFDADRRVPLPFLPRVVGLVCGRESKAEHDVVVNARARWPQVEFVIREVAVQGAGAVPQVSRAIAELDADPRVEVVVVARGGGSVEDLLPFSNEALVRAAAACRTPLVSAIGHETDTPLLDLVADYRASTPTDAAKRIVPDVGEERARVAQARSRIRSAVEHRVAREAANLEQVRSRPVLARPQTMVDTREAEVVRARDHARRSLDHALAGAVTSTRALAAQVRALSPAATLDRGYAVVQTSDGRVVREATEVAAKDSLRIRVSRGELMATVLAVAPGRRRPAAEAGEDA
ncbi:exodeoxyribonuclease VII large subunit [Cellulomonas pakistanensis]|uniref:Exodeoxyribonuclease 7 large subunit n=1 Tax=Cellulomonas pakistanensis TaxID=992287 RepID=A0A919U4X0_9CELL|nr:exodeoxyribonuclease VII large subunit [Cellulomonas pakistanensis]GIG37931.1 exodeoxyribonuclease 7 large subunit [Cellulomonas pakistanensis]